MLTSNSIVLAFFKRFILWFVLLQTIVLLIEHHPSSIAAIQHLLGSASARLYQFYSTNVVIAGNALINPVSGNYVTIDNACTGLSLIATLTAGLFALSGTIREKMGYFLLIILLIQVENIIRISQLFYLISHQASIAKFNFYHLFFWQFINFIYAMLVFYFIFINSKHAKQTYPN